MTQKRENAIGYSNLNRKMKKDLNFDYTENRSVESNVKRGLNSQNSKGFFSLNIQLFSLSLSLYIYTVCVIDCCFCDWCYELEMNAARQLRNEYRKLWRPNETISSYNSTSHYYFIIIIESTLHYFIF